MWSATGSLGDHELMAEGEVLEGDGGRTGEDDMQECPETDPHNHQGTPASGMKV